MGVVRNMDHLNLRACMLGLQETPAFFRNSETVPHQAQ